MKIPVVNERDEIIGFKERGEYLPSDIARASGLWIENTKGDVLLIKRSEHVSYAPNVWSILTGTVDQEETYISNIVKEADEELGIAIAENDLMEIEKVLCHEKNDEMKNRYFMTTFKIVKDVEIKDFNLDPREISEVKWVSKQELKQWFLNNKNLFFQGFEKSLEVFNVL